MVGAMTKGGVTNAVSALAAVGPLLDKITETASDSAKAMTLYTHATTWAADLVRKVCNELEAVYTPTLPLNLGLFPDDFASAGPFTLYHRYQGDGQDGQEEYQHLSEAVAEAIASYRGPLGGSQMIYIYNDAGQCVHYRNPGEAHG